MLLEPDDGPVLVDVLAALLPPAPADDVAGVPPHAPATTERIKPETSRNRMVPSYLSVCRFYVETRLSAMLRVALARTTFYIDAAGTIAFIDSDVHPSSHGKDVARKLAELGATKAH